MIDKDKLLKALKASQRELDTEPGDFFTGAWQALELVIESVEDGEFDA